MLRDARRDAGMSQLDTGDKIDSGQSVISNVETGTVGVSIWLLRRIAHALGCELRIQLVRGEKIYDVSS